MSRQTKQTAKPRKASLQRQRRHIKERNGHDDMVSVALPAEGFVRLPVVLGVFGTSKSTLWRWIAEKKFPAPFKVGPGTTAWDVASLRSHMERIRGGAA